MATVPLALMDGRSDKVVQVQAEETATPGLLVCEDPRRDGWLVAHHSGRRLDISRWLTAADAHTVAAALGGRTDWTRRDVEVVDEPHIRAAVRHVFDEHADRRYPIPPRTRPEPTKGIPASD